MTSQMAREICEIPAAVARLIADGRPEIRAAGVAARLRNPALIATVARGSSDHACTYLKYAAELTLGLPVASIGPSVASVYGAKLHMGNALCLTVSQSGQSPDIVEMARAAGMGGALTVAITNHPASPLGVVSQHCLSLHAGAELSVAATKTFVNSAVAGLMLIAEWAEDAALLAAIHALPAHLDRAVAQDWGALRDAVTGVDSLYTLGRGPAYAMAQEAALKFKEVARIHAESYSSAEVLHGPVSIVGQGFPVLALAVGDAAEAGVVAVADQMAAKGAQVFVTSDLAGAALPLPHVRTGHPLTDPLALIVSFYAMVEQVARARRIDPDHPRHLNKVTQTV
jgi:glutamine---fructose-6-phosphate transaminase (isomerizing)